MADDKTETTTAAAVTFRFNHLIRLRGLTQAALDGKLVRIDSYIDEATGRFKGVLLDDRARPPVASVPARRLSIKPDNMRHACEYCLVAAPEGEKLQLCGRCKTARYCNAACQGADWARHKSPDCVEFSHFRGWDKPLQSACMRGDVAEVRRLVEEEGADVDKATTNGATPLASAVLNGHLPVVRYLVEEQGADVDKARATSGTPLCVAAGKGFLLIVQYLVEHGADKNKESMDGLTPLYIAAGYGHLAVVQYLVEHGADKNKANNDGHTPLEAALSMGHQEVAAYLHAAGAK